MTTQSSHSAESARFEPRAGEMVGGRYLLEREIAKGGMGVVWAGDDQKLRRSVAIKLLTGSWSKSEDARMRFEREAMAVAQLQCPNVVQVFDYGIERSIPFIVMELMSGEDLHKRLKRQRRLSLQQTTDIVWQVAKALGMAHGAGIVHRDLKPANVFLVQQGDEILVKVLDFGVAKLQDTPEEPKKATALVGVPLHRMDAEGTKAGTVLGTPHFMSPEQARGSIKATDHRSDLWSLGIIAYRCLTGQLPFRGKAANEVIVKVCVEDPPPPSSINPDLTWEVDDFFERALAKNADERFQNAREMASALVNIGPMSMPSLRVPLPRPPLSSDMDSDIVPIDMSSLPELTPPPLSGRETPPPRSSADSLPSSAAPVSTSNRTFEAAIVDDPRSEEGKPSRRGRWLLAALLLAAGGVGVWLMNGGKLPLPTTSHESAAPAHAAPEVETGAPNAADEASQAPEEGVEESREAVASATASADEPQSEPSGEEAAPKPPNASIAPPRRRGTPAPPPQTPPSPAPVAKPGPASDPFAERL